MDPSFNETHDFVIVCNRHLLLLTTCVVVVIVVSENASFGSGVSATDKCFTCEKVELVYQCVCTDLQLLKQ